MPRPSRPKAVALTRIPITRVTTLSPIGPSRRAIGPAERYVNHIVRAVPPQTAVMIARSTSVE